MRMLLVFDLDGVLQQDRRVQPGAAALLQDLRAAGCTVRFLTNDGFHSRESRRRELAAGGLAVAAHELYTASYLAARYVAGRGPALVLSGPPADAEFAHLPQATEGARAVVVADWFTHYDAARLQAAFTALERGAELVAVHRKRKWHNDGQCLIDVGFWVAGLEHCARREAVVVGKPAAFAYRAVLDDAGFAPGEAVMVSDEADPDLLGARALGMRTVLFGAAAQQDAAADAAARTFAELAALLRQVGR